jgi:hypothetical protein
MASRGHEVVANHGMTQDCRCWLKDDDAMEVSQESGILQGTFPAPKVAQAL